MFHIHPDSKIHRYLNVKIKPGVFQVFGQGVVTCCSADKAESRMSGMDYGYRTDLLKNLSNLCNI